MAVDATHNPALQRHKFTDKLRGFGFPFCTRCYLGPARYVGKIFFTKRVESIIPSRQWTTRTASRLHSEMILPVCFRVPFTNVHSPTTSFNDVGGQSYVAEELVVWSKDPKVEREDRIHPQLHPVHGHAPWLVSDTDPTND